MTSSKPSSEEQFFQNMLSFLESSEIDLDRMTEQELDQVLKEEKINFSEMDKKFKDFWSKQAKQRAFRKAQAERKVADSGLLDIVLEPLGINKTTLLERLAALVAHSQGGQALVQHRNLQEMSEMDLMTLEHELKALVAREKGDGME